MTSITAETLATMSNEEFAEFVKTMPAGKVTLGSYRGVSLRATNSITLLGLVVQERIRRHALVCKEYACGFNPVAF